jgi:hypothetical protein
MKGSCAKAPVSVARCRAGARSAPASTILPPRRRMWARVRRARHSTTLAWRRATETFFVLRGDSSNSTAVTDRMALPQTTCRSGFRTLRCKSVKQEGER